MPVHQATTLVAAALLLGFVAGMRTMTPPALLAITLTRRPELVPAVAPAQWFTHRILAIGFGLAALGELVGDKLPQTPNRTALGPFVARLASGGICGATLLQLAAMNPWLGAVCGAVGAAAGAIGMFHLRIAAARTTGIRDAYIGATEDVLAIAIAASVIAFVLA